MDITNSETLEKITYLDCRKRENVIAIQKALRQIKPLAKYPTGKMIPLDKVEHIITVLTSKYCICTQWLHHTVDYKTKSVYWSASIKTDHDHKHLGSINGATIYETIAKTAILMYATTRGTSYKGSDINIPERHVWEQENKRLTDD